MDTSHEKLIGRLVQHGGKVKRLRSPGFLFLRWALVSSLYVAIAAWVSGFRNDYDSASRDQFFWIQAILLLSAALASGWSAFMMSVPGNSTRLRLLPWAVLSGWVIALAYVALSERDSVMGGLGCAAGVPWIALPPSLFFFHELRKAAPLRPVLNGLLALVSVGALCALALQFTCNGERAFHVLIVHCAPVALLGMIGAWLGARFLNRITR